MTQVHGHPHIDARVLDGARLTASKIDADPSLVAIGHENIERYCQQQRYLPRNQTEWLEILERPWPEVAGHPPPAGRRGAAPPVLASPSTGSSLKTSATQSTPGTRPPAQPRTGVPQDLSAAKISHAC